MARAPKRRARTPSSSPEPSKSSTPPPQQQQHQQDQSPYANSPTARVNLYLPSDATPARGHRFSTLRVVADPSQPPTSSTPDPSNIDSELSPTTERKMISQESKKEKANRERNERAARRRSERSEAPSPPDDSPWQVKRRAARAARQQAAKQKKQEQEKTKVKVENDDNNEAAAAVENDEADGSRSSSGSSAIGSSSAFKRRRGGGSSADVVVVQTGGSGPAADQDVVGIDASLQTPAPKRARRGAGIKAETVFAITAPDRALGHATSEWAAANPFVATSEDETVSIASDDGRGDGQAHKAATDRRRRRLVLLNNAASTIGTNHEGRFENSTTSSALFNKNYHLPGSDNDDNNDTGGENVGLQTRTIAHRSDIRKESRDPRPAILGTISTRRFAAFEEIPHTSPSPPPTPPQQLNQSDFRDELQDANIAAATTTPPSLRNYKLVDEEQEPTSQQQQQQLSASPSSSSSSSSGANATPFHMFEPTSGRFVGDEKKQHKMQAKDYQEILYEGRGQRRVSDGAQGLEFGKPPTPRKSKRRSRIVTMPQLLLQVAKKNYGAGGEQGDIGQQK